MAAEIALPATDRHAIPTRATGTPTMIPTRPSRLLPMSTVRRGAGRGGGRGAPEDRRRARFRFRRVETAGVIAAISAASPWIVAL